MEGALGRTVQEHCPHHPDDGGQHQRAGDDAQEAAHGTKASQSPDSVGRVAEFLTVAPILRTADMARMQSHYERLGFAVQVHHGGYATAARDEVKLHFHLMSLHDPAHHGGVIYLAVDDADAVHGEWVAAGVGQLDELWDPGFGVWESAHTDPDGNVIRFGSPVREGRRP